MLQPVNYPERAEAFALLTFQRNHDYENSSHQDFYTTINKKTAAATATTTMPRQYKNSSKPPENIRNTKYQAKRSTSAKNFLPNTEPSAKQKRNNTELAIITAI
jgi:hypothetical protein